jgi:putative protease
MGEYLCSLNDLGVDALIVQDLGIADLCSRLNIKVPLHASVQMGIGNLEAIKLLEDHGFTRVVLSKNLSLQEIAAIHDATRMGLEFFIHGDLCVSHTGQCYMSAFVSDRSGNRGRCLKPCRWEYSLTGRNGHEYTGSQYHLAYKDLCLYPYLKELIEAGVTSFKIEGRMRSAEYEAFLVSRYRQALDGIIAGYDGFDQQAWSELNEQRVRDYTKANIHGHIDRHDIGRDGSREPLFPTAPVQIKTLQADDFMVAEIPAQDRICEISVRVASPEDARELDALGIDNIIISCDFMRGGSNWTWENILELPEQVKARLLVETPRIVTQKDLSDVYNIKRRLLKSNVYGVIVNDLGSLNLFRDSHLVLWGGYGLNLFNDRAIEMIRSLGVQRITASLELCREELQAFNNCPADVEILVHGPLCGMISDYCLLQALNNDSEDCGIYCVQDDFCLQDGYGQKYRIRTDRKCRNYIFYPYDLSLFTYLPEINSQGIDSWRIDGQYYSTELLKQVVSLYLQAREQLRQGKWDNRHAWAELLHLFPQGLSAQPFNHS